MSGFRHTGKYKYYVHLHGEDPRRGVKFLDAESPRHAQSILLKHFDKAVAEHEIVDGGQFGYVAIERELIRKGWRKCFTLIDKDGNWYCGGISEHEILESC